MGMKKIVWALRLGIVVAGAALTMEQIQLNHQQHVANQRRGNTVIKTTANNGRIVQTADLPVLHVWDPSKDALKINDGDNARG